MSFSILRRAVHTATLCALLPAALGAQPASPTHLEAMIRVRQAQAALRRGERDEAARLLTEASNLGAPPLVHRELARTLEAMDRHRDAAAAWTRYAALVPDANERAAALQRRENLRRRTGPVFVRVGPLLGARRARVWVDRDLPRIYVAGGIEAIVEGGEHRVRVESPGFVPWEQRLTTAYGEPVEVRVTLRPGR